jgi:hypothetical protein
LEAQVTTLPQATSSDEKRLANSHRVELPHQGIAYGTLDLRPPLVKDKSSMNPEAINQDFGPSRTRFRGYLWNNCAYLKESRLPKLDFPKFHGGTPVRNVVRNNLLCTQLGALSFVAFFFYIAFLRHYFIVALNL